MSEDVRAGGGAGSGDLVDIEGQMGAGIPYTDEQLRQCIQAYGPRSMRGELALEALTLRAKLRQVVGLLPYDGHGMYYDDHKELGKVVKEIRGMMRSRKERGE